MTPSLQQHQAAETFSEPPRKRRPSKNHGRLHVLLLFVSLRVIDSVILFLLAPGLAVVSKQDLALFLGTSAVWTSGLLIAIWFQQKWARYMLSASLLLVIVSCLSLLPCLRDRTNPVRDLFVILGITAVYLPVVLVLLFSRDVRRLTEERNESDR